MSAASSHEQWSERIARFERGKVDAETFAAGEGVTKRQLMWWRWRVRRDEHATPSTTALSFVQLEPSTAPASGPMLELVVAEGRLIRVPTGFDEETLARLVAVVEGGAR